METEMGFAHEGRQFNIRWNLNTRRRRRRRFGGRAHHALGAYASREAREQKLILKPPLHAVLKYIVPSVLALITLRYQGKTESLFEKNPAPTWCFLVSTCVYSLILGGMEQTQILERWSIIVRRLALMSTILAIVSLLSIFLPYPMSIVPLIICASLQFVVLAWPKLYDAYSLIHRGIKSVFNNIRAKIGNLTEEASLPQ